MIDRYAIYSVPEEIAERFGIANDESFEAEYNAAPTKELPVIANVGRDRLSYFYWGTMSNWSNKKSISVKLINAPLDDLLRKSTLKSALENKRCIIPANGFYLWKTVGKKSRRPLYFALKNRVLFSIAGVWEAYDDMEGKMRRTFRMITTPNHLGMDDFGADMPAILRKEDEQDWLRPGHSAQYLRAMIAPLRSQSDLSFHPVSSFITKIENNYPELIQVQPPMDQKGNYTLF